MAADFRDAWTRHKEDGDLLYKEKRWANADYLYGLAAECGLKAVMQALGMAVIAPVSEVVCRAFGMVAVARQEAILLRRAMAPC